MGVLSACMSFRIQKRYQISWDWSYRWLEDAMSGAWNQTLVLSKSSHCSELLSHLSSPCSEFFSFLTAEMTRGGEGGE